MDQDAISFGGRLGPGDSVDSVLNGTQLPPKSASIFGPCLLCSKGWVDQDAIGTEIGLDTGDIVLDGLRPPSGSEPLPPISCRTSVVVKRMYGSGCHFV